MKIKVFNFNILDDFEISENELVETLEKLFSEYEMSVNVILVDEDEIRRLNKEFRDIDSTTDVLVFGPYGDIGEVYIYPYFIKENLRIILHGILHLLGYDHEGYFDPQNLKEEMFILQEEYLKKFYDILETKLK